MAIQGLRDTNGFVTDQRPKNWREAILLLQPNGKAPLTGLTSVMRTDSTDDPEFNWWEKSLPDQRTALTANLGSASSGDIETISVTDTGDQMKEGHVLRVEESGEILYVVSDPASATSVQVERGFAGTSPSSVDYDGSGVNPNVHVIGTAYEEGSEAPTGIARDPTKKYNYTQIFRNTLEATNTAIKTRLRTGDAVREAKREALEFHSIEMEKAFWFNDRSETTRNGHPLRTTRGILNWIAASNTTDRSGSDTTLLELEEDLKKAFDFGSQEKMGFCGNRAMLTIQQIVRKNASFELVQGQKEFGMNVNRLVTPFGEVVLKTHPLFNQLTGGTTSSTDYYGVDSWLFILDMENFRYRPLEGRDTKFQSDLQDNGLDGMKSGYLSEAGLELRHPETHYLIKGLRSAAADA